MCVEKKDSFRSLLAVAKWCYELLNSHCYAEEWILPSQSGCDGDGKMEGCVGVYVEV